jgi:dihydroorotase
METSLAAGITALVSKGYLTINELIQKMSTNPADILGIEAGSLREGSPADIVIFDMNESHTVDPKLFHGKSRNTPFKGMRLKGKVKYTVVNGEIVYKD